MQAQMAFYMSRSLSVSSVSSVSSATSSSSSVHTVDSDDMYADLASPVSSASSRSPTPAQTKKEKGMGAPCVLPVMAPEERQALHVKRVHVASVSTECSWSDPCTQVAFLIMHHSTKWHSTREATVVSVTMTKHFLSAGKSKKEDGVKEDKRKRDSSTQPPKSSKSSTGNKSSQQPTAPQQAPSGQPQQGAFVAHKEIKLTLLNKVRPWAHLVRAPGSHLPSAHPGTETKWGPSGHLNLVARYHPCSSACLDGQSCGKQRGVWA